MKKHLFGTTALAAVGLVLAGVSSASAQTAAPAPAPGFRSNSGFTVGISGYARQFVSTVQNKNGAIANRDGNVDQQSDWRPIFNFAMPLPNGMTAGAVLQMNPLNNTATGTGVVRRQWSSLSGGFGQIQLGALDGVAAQMLVGSNEQFTGGTVKNAGKIMDNVTAPSGNFPSRSIVASTNADMFDNGRPANKIAYFTPRFEGFQAGLSYAPANSSSIEGALEVANTQYKDIFSIAANYVGKVSSADVRAYAGYLTASKPSEVNLSDAQRAFHKDPTWYGFGAGVGFMGFDLGGSYAKIKDGRLNTQGTTTTAAALGTVTNDGRAWEFGLNYTFGAAGIGVNYFDGRNEAGTSSATGTVTPQANGDDKRTGVSLSGRYILAPGVNVEAIVFNAKQTTGLAASVGTHDLVNRSTTANGALTALILAF